jgi:hypothetical protein
LFSGEYKEVYWKYQNGKPKNPLGQATSPPNLSKGLSDCMPDACISGDFGRSDGSKPSTFEKKIFLTRQPQMVLFIF